MGFVERLSRYLQISLDPVARELQCNACKGLRKNRCALGSRARCIANPRHGWQYNTPLHKQCHRTLTVVSWCPSAPLSLPSTCARCTRRWNIIAYRLLHTCMYTRMSTPFKLPCLTFQLAELLVPLIKSTKLFLYKILLFYSSLMRVHII